MLLQKNLNFNERAYSLKIFKQNDIYFFVSFKCSPRWAYSPVVCCNFIVSNRRKDYYLDCHKKQKESVVDLFSKNFSI